MQNYHADYPHLWKFVKNSYVLGKTGIVINCAMNFVFYCLSGTNFWMELVQYLSFTKDDRAKVYSVKLMRCSSPLVVSYNDDTGMNSENLDKTKTSPMSSVMNESSRSRTSCL